MRCVLVDDEPKALEIIQNYVKRVPFLEVAGAFREPVQALQFLAGNPVDLVFLDINMPDMSGIQFLNALHTRPLVIFTTAYSEYAVRSYDYDAVDYLLKPIEFERFLRAAIKALEFHRQREPGEQNRLANGAAILTQSGDYLVVKSGTDYHKLQMDDILYIEAAGNYAVFVTAKTNVMSLMSMKDLGSMLPQGRFFRIHKSYIVNFRHVSKIERDQVMIGTKPVPIGETFRESFLKALQLTK
jgi:two-component system LytT family response regulator